MRDTGGAVAEVAATLYERTGDPPSLDGSSKPIVAVALPAEIEVMWGAEAGAATTSTVRETAAAAPHVASPAWVAEIVHWPVPLMVTVPSEVTEQTELPDVTEKPRGRPLDALAVSTNGVPPYCCAAGWVNEIVCESLPTVTLWETWVAAFHWLLPDWDAEIVHVPAERKVTDPEDIEQVVPDPAVIDTVGGRPLVEVAAGA